MEIGREEMDLVAAPEARIFAVGNAVTQHLERRAFPRPFTAPIHYSGLAARAHAAGIVGQEDRFAGLGVQCLSATSDKAGGLK
jgi:hypothetical protein